MATQTATIKEWKEVEFGSLCAEILGGGTPSTKIEEYWIGQIPWITSKWLGGKLFLHDGEKTISEDAVRNSATHVVPKNNLLVSTRVGIGKVGINTIPLAISQDLTGIVVSKEADVTFLAYQLLSDRIQQHLLSLRRGATIQGITREDLKKIVIYVPPLPEQKAIAKVLTTVREAIAGQEALIAKLKDLKRRMMHHLFTHGAKGEKTKMTEIGEMPESWDVTRLGDVGEVSYGIQAAVASLLKPIGFKILTNKNITLQGDIVFDKVNYYQPKTKRELSSFVEKGDVLLNWRSGSKEHVGKTAIYFGDEKILHSSFILRIRTNQDKVINKFLYYYINWLRETGYFVKLQTYSVNAKFNKSAVLAMDIAVPPINQQVQILEAVDSIVHKIELTTLKLSGYQELFKILLHELMSGERRVGTSYDH